jgi:hypothetical protein
LFCSLRRILISFNNLTGDPLHQTNSPTPQQTQASLLLPACLLFYIFSSCFQLCFFTPT